MAKYVLQELPEELTDGKKVVFPKMQTYSLDDYETVVKHMHDCDGTFSEGVIRGVFSAFMSAMKIWMPMATLSRSTGWACFCCRWTSTLHRPWQSPAQGVGCPHLLNGCE